MPLRFLPRPRAAVAAALLSSCAVTPRPAGTTVIPIAAAGAVKAEAAREIVGELAARRARFLTTGDLREVFSVFYYHTTTAILRRVKNGAVSGGDLIVEMIVDFYGDYDRNRSPAAREAHWQPYYALAAGAKARNFKTGRELIQRGIEAHIDHDLPQVLMRLFQRHPDLRGPRLDKFEAALESLNDLFLPCSVLGFQDLAKVLPNAPGARGMVFQSRIARAIVRHKRHRAWTNAAETLH